MGHQWSVRLYREGDEQGILKLMNLAGIQRKIEEWSWEYEKNPFGCLIGVAEYDRQIIGHMALVSVFIKTSLRSIKGCQAVDLIVHPKFRGQGIFLAIGKFLMNEAGKQGIDIAYGFPNKPAHSGHLKYGWFDICKVPFMIKPMVPNLAIADFLPEHRITEFLNRFGTTKKITNSLLSAVLGTISFASKIFNRIEIRNVRSIKVRRVETADDRIDEFWNDVSKDYTNIVVRNNEYMNWRFFQKPNPKYTTLVAEERGRILGYIVLCTRNEKNIKYGCVIDILASLKQKSVIQLLLLKAVEELERENVNFITCWMLNNSQSGRVYYKILKANGFVRVRSNPFIARVNSLGISAGFICTPADWYVTIADSDQM